MPGLPDDRHAGIRQRGVLTNRNEEHMGSTTFGDATPLIGLAAPSKIERDRGSRRVSPVART